MRKFGRSIKEISDILGRSKYSVENKLKRCKIKARYIIHPKNPLMVKLLDWHGVRSLKELSKKLNVPYDTLKYWSSKRDRVIMMNGGYAQNKNTEKEVQK